MNIGPAEILVVLVVALIAFGPKRLPEVGRQVGAAMRELRRMQHTVRSELDAVLHPDVTPPDPSQATSGAVEDTDHSMLPPPATENSDEGFAGPGSFS
jgi:sec-independent protein translocase protein TatA